MQAGDCEGHAKLNINPQAKLLTRIGTYVTRAAGELMQISGNHVRRPVRQGIPLEKEMRKRVRSQD